MSEAWEYTANVFRHQGRCGGCWKRTRDGRRPSGKKRWRYFCGECSTRKTNDPAFLTPSEEAVKNMRFEATKAETLEENQRLHRAVEIAVSCSKWDCDSCYEDIKSALAAKRDRGE